MKIVLKYDLSGAPNWGESINSLGRNKTFSDKKIIKKDIFAKSLSRFQTNLKKSDVIKKINILMLKVSESNNVEVIQKSSTGQNFRNFINLQDFSKKELDNIAFIARFDGFIEGVDFPSNAIIMTVNLVTEGKNEKQELYAKLVNIEVANIQPKNYLHSKVLKLKESLEFIQYEADKAGLKFVKNNPLLEFNNLEKSLDIWGNNEIDSLRLKDFESTIDMLNKYMKNKRKEVIIPYFISDEETFTISHGTNFKLYAWLDSGYDITKRSSYDRFIISHESDTNTKMYVNVSGVKIEENYLDWFNDEKKSIDLKQKAIKKIITSFENKNVEFSKQIKKMEVKQFEQENKLNILLNQKKDFINEQENKNKKARDLSILIKEKNKAIKLKNNILQNTKKQKASIIKLNETEINKLINKKVVIEKSLININSQKKSKNLKNRDKKIKKINEDLVNIENSFIKLKDKKNDSLFTKKEDELIISITLKIKDFQEEIAKINLKLNLCQKEISDLENEKAKKLNEIKAEEEKLDSTKYKIIDFKKQISNNKKDITINSKTIFKYEELIKKIDINNNLNKEENKKLYVFNCEGYASNRSDNFQKSFDINVSKKLNIILADDNQLRFSDFDIGLASVIKRYSFAFQTYKQGTFKSPYGALSLDKPNVKIKVTNINSDIGLNSLQQQALNASSQAHFASFLQGPPGTGKTQVIAASIINSVNKGENIIISSSTNAAIDNALDRLFEVKNNPNIFILRWSTNKAKLKEHPEFTDIGIYKNFINNLDGHVNKSNDLIAHTDIEMFKKAIRDENIKKYYVPLMNFKKYITSLSEDSILKLSKKLGFSNFGDELEDIIEDIISRFQRNRKNLKKSNSLELVNKIDNFITNNKNKFEFKIGDSLEKYFANLSSHSKNSKSFTFHKLINNLNKNFNNKNKEYPNVENINDEFTKVSIEFVKYLFENDLINVIGITTTSKMEISVFESKAKELFTGYRIDNAIIDEISKSVTPEILNVAKLSMKFMFAGDYRQLPPTFPFTEKLLQDFKSFIDKEDENRKSSILKQWSNKGYENFEKEIDNLFSVSLFSNLVEKMKITSNIGQTSYTALKSQYRFNSLINEIVNLTYDKNEKLTSYYSDKEFLRYVLGNKKPSKSFVDVIDTSYLTDDFRKYLKKENQKFIKVNSDSFDQNDSLIINRNYNSRINDFNAFVILETVKNLLKKNPKLNPNNIGVIAMTRSQVTHIKRLVSKDAELKYIKDKIKIDTVDNFQGKEREIIILDLVVAKNKFFRDKVEIKNPKNRIVEFYKEPRRINVAASRAKAKLIIVGSLIGYMAQNIESTLQINNEIKQIKLFNEWLKIVSNKGEVREWKEF